MIACYGEALVDLFVRSGSQTNLRMDTQACLGGSVFNFCLAVQRQGVQSVYLNALSSDGFGRQFDHVLRAQGVLLDSAACSEPTSIAVIELDAQGNASYAFHREAVADTSRSANTIIAAWRSSVHCFHTGCLMLTPRSWLQTRDLIAHAQRRGCVVSVDTNLRPAVVADLASYRSCVVQAVQMAHVVKVSDDDLVALNLLPNASRWEDRAAVDAAQSLFDGAPELGLVALTLGARGAHLLTRQHSVHAQARGPVKVEDTVGAGDSFVAALLAYLDADQCLSVRHLTQGLTLATLQRAAQHAVAAATLCVARKGCDPATWRETLAAA